MKLLLLLLLYAAPPLLCWASVCRLFIYKCIPREEGMPSCYSGMQENVPWVLRFVRGKVSVEGISNTFSNNVCFFFIGHYFETDYWTSSIDFEIKMLVGQNELIHFNQKYVDFDSLECCVSVHHLILHFTHFEFPANITLWIEKRFRHYHYLALIPS